MTRYLAINIGIVIALAVVWAQSPGVYTAAQATAGRAAYQANCASCHVPDLSGRNEAPPLAGGSFMNTWRNRTTRDLFDYMQATMPPNAPSLSADQYLAITSFILQSNGMPPGSQPLTSTTAPLIGAGSIVRNDPSVRPGPTRGSSPPAPGTRTVT